MTLPFPAWRILKQWVIRNKMSPAPFKKQEEWVGLARYDHGLQIEAVTAALCLAEGMPANSSDQFFMACHPDSDRARTLRFFPAHHILPVLATFDLTITRTANRIAVR